MTVDQQLDRVHLRLNVVHMALHNHHLRLQLLELILHQTQVSRCPIVSVFAEEEDVVLIRHLDDHWLELRGAALDAQVIWW